MIRWGILGAGNIAKRFIASLEHFDDACLYAVGSYTPQKREEFRHKYPHIVVYDNYMDLIDDNNIDIIYIATRHKDHYQWAKEALLKNKAVLCEKPATLSYQQTKELSELAKTHQTLFLEGMKTRFIPLIAHIKEILDHKIIGDVLRVETCFAYDAPYRPGHYLHDLDEGGILYDVGSYNIASILDYIDSKVVDIQVNAVFDQGVDVNDQIELIFDSGQTALIDIAMNENKEKRMTITGTQGKITACPFYRPEKAIISLSDEDHIIEKKYLFDDFYTEIQEAHRCYREHLYESPRMTLQDSLDIIEVIEKIKLVMKGESYGI